MDNANLTANTPAASEMGAISDWTQRGPQQNNRQGAQRQASNRTQLGDGSYVIDRTGTRYAKMFGGIVKDDEGRPCYRFESRTCPGLIKHLEKACKRVLLEGVAKEPTASAASLFWVNHNIRLKFTFASGRTASNGQLKIVVMGLERVGQQNQHALINPEDIKIDEDGLSGGVAEAFVLPAELTPALDKLIAAGDTNPSQDAVHYQGDQL